MTDCISLKFKWADTVAPLFAVIKDGTEKGRNDALEELRRMARVADLAVSQQGDKRLDEMPLTSGDNAQALTVVWAALERLDLDDAENDQLNTAMAWLEESI